GDVRFLGTVEFRAGLQLVSECDVALLPLRPTPHTVKTVANKLFEYMMVGTPVLASDLPPVKRILDETGAGLCFEFGREADFVGKLRLLADRRRGREIGRQGKRWVASKYNFAADADRLSDLVRTFAK
ncbi:MAG TPA: glycosyltransferase, partial [Candidatus Deferrimicrobiaceae bacterium]